MAKNFAYGTVLTAPSPATSGTSLVLNSGQGALMPAVPFPAVIGPIGVQPTAANAEIVTVTGIATDTLTIVRTAEGSSARTVIVGDQLAAVMTAELRSQSTFFDSKSATDQSFTLKGSTDHIVQESLNVGSGNSVAVPSGSSLEIKPPVNAATANQAGLVRLANHLGGSANQPVVTAPVHENMLLNGGFDVWQRNTSFATFTDDTYGPDRWNLLSSTTAQWSVSQSSNAPAGFKSSAKCTQASSTNGQFMLAQFLENIDAMKLAGQTVSLSFWAQTTAGKEISNLRATILSWNSTADVLTSDVVATWNGAGTDPAWATNWLANKPGSNLALGQQWQRFTVEGIVLNSANMANLALVIWSDDTTVATNDEFYITGIQINIGASAAAFQPRPYVQELDACQRYCWAYSTAAGGIVGNGYATQTTVAAILVATKVPLRLATPVLTATGSDWQIADSVNAGIDATAISISGDPPANSNMVWLTVTVAGATQFRPYQLRGDSAGTRVIILDAEL